MSLAHARMSRSRRLRIEVDESRRYHRFNRAVRKAACEQCKVTLICGPHGLGDFGDGSGDQIRTRLSSEEKNARIECAIEAARRA